MDARKAVEGAIARGVEDGGAGCYAGTLLSSTVGLVPGEQYVLVVAAQTELFAADGRRWMVPRDGEVVEFHGVGRWQLRVARAVFGHGRIAMLGVQGGAEADWTVYAPPVVLTRIVVPGDATDGDGRVHVRERAPEMQWRNDWQVSGMPWAEAPDRMLVARSMDFERLYGVAVAEPTLPQLGHRLVRSFWKARERVALFFAPWLGRE